MAQAIEIERGASLWQDALRRLAKNALALIGFIVVCVMVTLALLTPWIAPYAYDAQDLQIGAVGPCAQHWCGTDHLGRDLLTRILYGGRISLLVGFRGDGGIAADRRDLRRGVRIRGGRLDSLLMRIVDILYTLPFTILVIILMVFFGRSLVLLFLAIGAVQWLTMARIVRGHVMSLRNTEFIDAAVIMGFSRARIILRHVIPNVMGPAIVYTTLTIPSVMLMEAFLSFLGLGVQAPMSSWGVLIKEGADCMEEYPWLLVFPSLVLSVTLFSMNFLGDGLRDALDPRASKD